MIRSRDLIVFVVIILSLFLAIAITLAIKIGPNGALKEGLVFFDLSKEASTTFIADKTEDQLNTEDTITRLRRLLAQNDTVIVPAPSVADTDDAPENIGEASASSVTLKTCGGDDALFVSQQWPQEGVQLKVENGFRTVIQVKTEVLQAQDSSTTSSSSVTTTKSATTTLLQMRAYPVVLGSSNCIPSDVIGVTADGRLLMNQDTTLYQQRGPDDLIGYARDGFPIYGMYGGVTDACGGYHHTQGYRYSIGKDRDFMIGCYVGIPSPFLRP